MATVWPGCTWNARCSGCVRVTSRKRRCRGVSRASCASFAPLVEPHAHALQRAREHHLFHRALRRGSCQLSDSRSGASSTSSGRSTATTSCSRLPPASLGACASSLPLALKWMPCSSARASSRLAAPRNVATKRVAGRVYSSSRPPDLEQAPEVHHADAIGEREGFFLVVRDEHRGDAELALHLADGAPQLLADLRVQRAEGLIEQQHLGLVRQRARHGDALLLAAGELRGQTLVHAFERHEPQQLLAPLRAGPRASCAARAARIRCCPPPSCGGTARSSGTRGRLRARARPTCVTSRPWSAMRPWSTPVRPAMARSSVLLPLPLGPSSTKNSPSPISTETSLTTGTP